MSNFVTDVLMDSKSDISIVDSMGDDHAVVQAARVSYANDDVGWRGEADEKLIRYMANHGHTTPFEHTSVKFHVSCPLFVRAQWHRHRMWSYNEISRRYTSDDLQFYFPTSSEWRIQDKNNKQSSSDLLRDVIGGEAALELGLEAVNLVYQGNLTFYRKLIELGVGREQARMFLPQNTYTRFYATANLHSIAHFINLRADEHAQWEIRQYAISMREQLREIFPVSIAALCDPAPEPVVKVKPWYKKIPLLRGLT